MAGASSSTSPSTSETRSYLEGPPRERKAVGRLCRTTRSRPLHTLNHQVHRRETQWRKSEHLRNGSLTQRTITERMEEDPVYFEKISALIQKAIDDHRAQRISELEFLNIVGDAREQVVRPRHEDVPQHLRGDVTAVAFYHAIEKQLAAVSPHGADVKADAAEAAETMLGIIARRRVVNWTQRN